jgi:hypothetical protein
MGGAGVKKLIGFFSNFCIKYEMNQVDGIK